MFTEGKWFSFADPVPHGWYIDVKLVPPYVVTGKQHKVRKIVNSGTQLCSYIPKTNNIVISNTFAIRTSNNRQGVLKMVSEFSPARIIGSGLPTSTIFTEIFLGDRPDNFVDVLPGFKLKWTQAHANKKFGVHIIVQETP